MSAELCTVEICKLKSSNLTLFLYKSAVSDRFSRDYNRTCDCSDIGCCGINYLLTYWRLDWNNWQYSRLVANWAMKTCCWSNSSGMLASYTNGWRIIKVALQKKIVLQVWLRNPGCWAVHLDFSSGSAYGNQKQFPVLSHVLCVLAGIYFSCSRYLV